MKSTSKGVVQILSAALFFGSSFLPHPGMINVARMSGMNMDLMEIFMLVDAPDVHFYFLSRKASDHLTDCKLAAMRLL